MPDHAFIAPSDDGTADHVGTYRRVLPVSLERMYENALDWEHLPFLHSSSFSDIRCEEAGGWGWRADVQSPRGDWSLLELRLDRRLQRWITTNLQGPNKGASIWTYVLVRGPQELEIVVDFFVPGVAPDAREKVGRAYARAYETLYDEDVFMMTERHAQLERRIDAIDRTADTLVVGAAAKVDTPMLVQFAGRELVLDRLGEDFVTYPARCPHMLAPLLAAEREGAIIRCPWHGYRFDLQTGECVSGQNCSLRSPASVEIDDGNVVLSLNSR